MDVDALQVSSVELWMSLGEEVAWLDQNPAEPCFAALHAKYSEAMDVLYEALDQISDGAIYLDAELLSSGADLMTQGTELIYEANAMINPAAAACGI